MSKLIYILLLTIVSFSCQNSVSENITESSNSQTYSQNLVNSKIITMDGFYFAHRKDNGVIEVDPPVFTRGELIYFVLRNVGDFATDKYGEAEFDMHMHILNDIGENVIVKRNILNKRGKRKIKNNRLALPNARFQTTSKDKPGTYHFYITIEDKITSDSITVDGDFFLE